jgi:methylmalonyl-CoA epimerase
VPEQKVETYSFQAGESEIELLKPVSPDSPVSTFLTNKGAGIHHLALRVENLEVELAKLKAKGLRLIDEVPRIGAGGKKIAFIHPKSTGGILIELTQVK